MSEAGSYHIGLLLWRSPQDSQVQPSPVQPREVQSREVQFRACRHDSCQRALCRRPPGHHHPDRLTAA